MEPQEPAPADRPDDDDYDLLTYGEASARLTDLLNSERARLNDLLHADPTPDEATISAARSRIAQLEEAEDRYRGQAESADRFEAVFGIIPRLRDLDA
jgi:hypothetical protein